MGDGRHSTIPRRRGGPKSGRRARVSIWVAAMLVAGAAVLFHAHARSPVVVPADRAEVTFRVAGMHCAYFCPIRVGDALSDVDGIYRTWVDVSRGEVTVLYDDDRVAPSDLRGRIDAMPDYRVRERTDE